MAFPAASLLPDTGMLALNRNIPLLMFENVRVRSRASGSCVCLLPPQIPLSAGTFRPLAPCVRLSAGYLHEIVFQKNHVHGVNFKTACEWPPNAEKGVPPHSRELKHNGG